MISFAVQRQLGADRLARRLDEDEGHLPLPGASPASVATQLSTSASIADAVPGHAIARLRHRRGELRLGLAEAVRIDRDGLRLAFE